MHKRTAGVAPATVNPFPTEPEKAGVWIAAGDLDGDGLADLVASAGPGGGPHVKVFDGFSSNLKYEIASPRDSHTGVATGRFIAIGHFSDGQNNDLVVGPGPGEVGTIQVYRYNPATIKVDKDSDVPGFGNLPYGMSVAAGDLDGPSIPGGMIAAGRQKELTGHVTLIKRTIAPDGSASSGVVHEFSPFAGAFGPGMAVQVASGADNLPGHTPFLVTATLTRDFAAGAGGGPHVKLFHVTGEVQPVGVTYSETQVADFVPNFLDIDSDNDVFDAMRVATGDVTGDGIDDLIVSAHRMASSPGGGMPIVKIFEMLEGSDGQFTIGQRISVDLSSSLADVPQDLQSSVLFNVAFSNTTMGGGGSGGSLLLSPTLVPEPGSAIAFIGVGLGTVMARRRTRRI